MTINTADAEALIAFIGMAAKRSKVECCSIQFLAGHLPKPRSAAYKKNTQTLL